MFDDLKAAILKVNEENDKLDQYCKLQFLDEAIQSLMRVYALYFIEPEDDKEFSSYQDPLVENENED